MGTGEGGFFVLVWHAFGNFLGSTTGLRGGTMWGREAHCLYSWETWVEDRRGAIGRSVSIYSEPKDGEPNVSEDLPPVTQERVFRICPLQALLAVEQNVTKWANRR